MNNKDRTIQLAIPYLPLKLVHISNTMHFPAISKQKYYNWLLTLGFLEVVEMEFDEGSE